VPRTVRALGCIALLLLVAPAPGHAQVFLAGKPHPEFTIGPLFVIANVRPDLSVVTVTLNWSVTPARGRRAVDIRGDLYVLWPGEVVEATAEGPAEPSLATYIEQRGFAVTGSGRLAMRSRDRMQLGTGVPGDLLPQTASFVTFARRGLTAAPVSPGTYIKIPWTPKLVDPLTLTSLTLNVRNLLAPKPATWLEELFYGRRWILSVGFGDVGSLVLPLYPLYFEQRDRLVHLAREYSLAVAIFTDGGHLRIEEIAPSTATRRASPVRAGAEVVSMPLVPLETTAPQMLRVQFAYFSGVIAWRPILVSGLLLLLGNIAGLLILSQNVSWFVRTRLHLRRRHEPEFARESGRVLPRGAADTIIPGSSSEADVLALFGAPDEEQRRRGTDARRTLVYRGVRRLPRSRLALGPLATVARWDEEHHELEVEIDGERVSAVHSRVRRARAAG
jgi:hypothetical protein